MLTVTIDHLGGLGDGVAETGRGRLHVPLTAPGDVANVAPSGKDRAELSELLSPGPARVTPPCRHFGRCGGCALQHLDREFIADWKQARVASALSRDGVSPGSIGGTIAVPPRTRRRATLAALRIGRRVVLGFTERASHQLVDLAECWVLRPELVALVGPLRDRLPALLENRETADIAVTATQSGVDLLLVRKRPLSLADRETLAAMAEDLDLARVAWTAKQGGGGEPVAVRRQPTVDLAGHLVPLPPAGFLQPSAEGQDALTRLVVDALCAAGGGPIADLFCGVGTFALPAGAFGPVAAYDGDMAAVTALNGAKRPGITARQRDLFREPLTATELQSFATVILDPPRAGAQAQARMLAASSIAFIVYASCNPTSFARDAAILAEGGYHLDRVTPVDQFLWSPHIELVGVFRRD